MKRELFVITIIITIIAVFMSGCTGQGDINASGIPMKVISEFVNGDQIPAEFTCDGEGISPPFVITDVPEGTESFAIIIEDSDAPAGTFTHLIAWNIPVSTTNIPRGNVPGELGINDFGKKGYGAPCPPSGLHHYYFRVYAIDTMLDIPSGIQRKAFDIAIKDHIITKSGIVGVYSRVG